MVWAAIRNNIVASAMSIRTAGCRGRANGFPLAMADFVKRVFAEPTAKAPNADELVSKKQNARAARFAPLTTPIAKLGCVVRGWWEPKRRNLVVVSKHLDPPKKPNARVSRFFWRALSWVVFDDDLRQEEEAELIRKRMFEMNLDREIAVGIERIHIGEVRTVLK